MYQTYKSKVAEIKKLSNSLTSFCFSLIEPTNIEFKSGQFISIFLPENKGMRSYSISSCDMITNEIEITVNIFDTNMGGAGVNYLNSLQIGDEVSFRGSFGIFTLENTKCFDHEGEVIWIATGSGIGPIKSMLELYNNKMNHRNILYFGIRNESEIAYQDFFEDLRIKFPNFGYKYCVSQPSDSWTGVKGRVTEHITRDNMSNDKKNIKAYICGSTVAVQSVYKALIEDGFDPANLHFENFG